MVEPAVAPTVVRVAGSISLMATTTRSNPLKRFFIGKPIATSEDGHQRLPKKVALPVFASDAISSTTYATEEILIVFMSLAGAGVAAYSRLVPISILVIFLLIIVVSSYRQTIFAYPNGGGSYVVSRENLGRIPSLVAGGSMLVDYILTGRRGNSFGVQWSRASSCDTVRWLHCTRDTRQPSWPQRVRGVVCATHLSLHHHVVHSYRIWTLPCVRTRPWSNSARGRIFPGATRWQQQHHTVLLP